MNDLKNKLRRWNDNSRYLFNRIKKNKLSKSMIALKIKELHIDFEEIHPFEDGNGRVGRMLYNYQRLLAGLPLDIIYVGKREEYYQWFRDRRFYNLIMKI